jgi:two-component system, OmpR family, response regulator VanR
MRVLIVEDEPYMAEAIRDGLRLEAIAADIAGDGNAALQLLSVGAYDIAVLDRDVPGPTGDEVAEHIVASGSGMPILMLTAADRLDDKASGFELGADDYLTKPFGIEELLARVRALLRRTGADAAAARFAADGIEVDLEERTVRRGGEAAHLTPTEWRLLEALASAPGKLRTHAWLLEQVWGDDDRPDVEALRVFVSQLRRKVEPDPRRPRVIRTEPGVGYRWQLEPV